MIAREDYLFVKGDNADAAHPNGDMDRIVIDGGIYGVRDNPNEVRGEDIVYLMEAYCARHAISGYGDSGYATEADNKEIFSRRITAAQMNRLEYAYKSLMDSDNATYPSYGGLDDFANRAYYPSVRPYTVRGCDASRFWRGNAKLPITFTNPGDPLSLNTRLFDGVDSYFMGCEIGCEVDFSSFAQNATLEHAWERGGRVNPDGSRADYPPIYDEGIITARYCRGDSVFSSPTTFGHWDYWAKRIEGSGSLRIRPMLSEDSERARNYVAAILPAYHVTFDGTWRDENNSLRYDRHGHAVVTGSRWYALSADGSALVYPMTDVPYAAIESHFGRFTRATPSAAGKYDGEYYLNEVVTKIDSMTAIVRYSGDICQ